MIEERYPRISVIILNYNGKECLEFCVGSVLNTDYPNFEVLLVDNGSTDGSAEFTEEKFGKDKRLKIIRNARNLGCAEGTNVGIRLADGEYIVSLNNDVEVDPNWLKELIKVMEYDRSIGATQSKLLLISDRKRFDSAGHYIDIFGHPSGRAKRGELDEGQYDHIDEIFMAKGTALTIRKEVVNKVGIFDPEYFMLGEDTDLCWRTWLSGYRVVFVPKSVAYHMPGVSRRKLHEDIWAFHRHKNLIMSMTKNYENKNLAKYLLTYIIVDTRLALGLLLLKRQYDVILGLIKAILWNILNLRDIWRKRLEVQQLMRKVRDENLIGRVIIKPKPILLYLVPSALTKK